MEGTEQEADGAPVAYSKLPERLPEATEFSADADLCDPVWVIEQIQRYPDIVDDLYAKTTLERRYGRKRIPGRWSLIMLAFVLSGEVDVEPFARRHRTSRIWDLAGFSYVPTPQTIWNRLTELEAHSEAFVEAANKLIQRAIGHEPRIARWVWVDATAFHTHAALEHCCPDRAACKAKGGNPRKRIERATDERVKEERHAEAEKAPPRTRRAPDALKEVPARRAPNERPPKRRRPYRYFELNGHLYRTLDPDAGARVYRGPRNKFWFGGLDQSAVSLFVGAPLALNLIPASKNEFQTWPDLYERLMAATGTKPEAVVMDRGYSVRQVFEHNTREGIASVIPWRQHRTVQSRADLDTDRFDRHGIPRCKHCGGPGDIESAGLGFYRARGEPRLRFRCQLRCTPDCSQTQSIACSEEWRLLVPMSRRSPTYHALSQAGKNPERVFRHWRDRYSVNGNSVDGRPKRPGIAWQNLRASAALLLEWFRLSLRHGWIGSHRRRNQSLPFPLRGNRRPGSTLSARLRHGLDLPYGQAAIQAGLAAAGGGGPPNKP